MKNHPLSEYFPMLPTDEYKQLKESISDHGLRESIMLLDGMILDGRNRHKACLEVGVEPRFEEYKEGTGALDFVVDMNMRRRHLSEGQKAQIVIDIEGKPEPMSKIEAQSVQQGTQPADRAPSYAELARKAGVSSPTIQRVAKVQDDEGLKSQLREGKIEAETARRIYEKAHPPEKPLEEKQAEYNELDDVAWVVEFIGVWTKKIKDFQAAQGAGKFSPEAKRFLAGRIRKHTATYNKWADVLDKEGADELGIGE